MSSTAISTVTANPLTLSSLPPEVIQTIVENLFDSERETLEAAYWEPCRTSWDAWVEPEPILKLFQVWRDALNLAATCKDLYRLVSPMVYKLDAEVNESSAMMISAKRGNIAALTKSLSRGASVHVGDCTEAVVIRTRVMDGDSLATHRKIWFPLELRGQVTAIHWASYLGRHDVLDILLKHGAEADSRVFVDHMIAHYETMYRRFKKEHLMVKYPVNFICRPFIGTLEQVARPMVEIVDAKYLCQVLGYGANPLYFALLTGQVEVARSLIQAGSSLLTHIGTRLHALHQAVDRLDVDMVRLIMEDETVDPNVRDARGETPFHYIRNPPDIRQAFKAHQIIDILVKRGADLGARDMLGFTPLNSYISAGHPLWSVAVAFIRAGSKIFEGFWTPFRGTSHEAMIQWAIESSCEKGSDPQMVAPAAGKYWPVGAPRICYEWFYMKFHSVNRVPDEFRDLADEEWEFYWTAYQRDLDVPVRPIFGGLWELAIMEYEDENEEEETEEAAEERTEETTREENTGESSEESPEEEPEQPDQEPEEVDDNPDQEFDEDFDGEFDYDENFAKMFPTEFVEDDELWGSL